MQFIRKHPWQMIVALVILATARPVTAQTAQAEQPPLAAPKLKLSEKRVSFEMRDRPWSRVLEWLSDQTGVHVISSLRPTGTFNYISPQTANGPVQLTIPEVIDVINEALLEQKYVLIRREASFTIVAADQKIPPEIVPRVAVEDLSERGKTEIVCTEVVLRKLLADEFAPEVKRMMGPFGEVIPLAVANQLQLQDTAGNLRRIIATINKIENNDENGDAQTFTHKCIYMRARDAEARLKDVLGDPKVVMELTQSRSGGRDQQPTTRPKIRVHAIISDERTNSVMVSGPADKIALARSVMQQLDVPQGRSGPVAIGPPILQTHPVPNGNAEVVATTLQDIYKNSGNMRISAVGSNSIIVWAGPEDQIEIAKHIDAAIRRPAPVAELIPVQTLEATKVAETLKGMFADVKTGAPYIEADATRNVIIVKGSKEQVDEARAILSVIEPGQGSRFYNGNMRIISLEKGSAATLANALERMLSQMRQNPVRVVRPGSEADEPRIAPMPKADAPCDDQPHSQLSDPRPPQAKEPVNDLPGNKNAPVTITAFGNKLIVSSEDPQALALVQELVRLLTQTQAGEGDFEIIRLKRASAVDAAKILDEAFNGPKQQQQQRGESGGSPFGGILGGLLGGGSSGGGGPPGGRPGSSPAAGTPRVERIRIVADTATNSLLVKATPLDMLTIRDLLKRAIDSGETDSEAIERTWFIGPLKHANATDVARVIEGAYRERMSQDARRGVVGGFSGFSFFGGGFSSSRGSSERNDASGNARAVTLSVGVDDRTNSLVVVCATPLFEDIKKLVEQMEKVAGDSPRTVRVVTVKGIDPNLVQQAIDAISGTKTTQSRPGSSGSSGFGGSTPGSSGFPSRFGSGSGGFTPGGGSGGFSPGGFSPGGGGGGGDSDRRRFGGGQSRGPDFFVDRVKDDPQTSLFDPRHESTAKGDASPLHLPSPSGNEAGIRISPALQQVGFTELPPQPGEVKLPIAPAPRDQDLRAPRLPVEIESLPELGVVVVSGSNKDDVEAVLRIIEYIQRTAAGSEVEIRIVPLREADATSVTSILAQLFQRVNLGANATTTTPQSAVRPLQGIQGGGVGIQSPTLQGSVVMLPLPRLNSILVAVPKARMDDVLKEIARLDVANSPQGRATPFQLKRASAARVAQQITTFYAQRYPNESALQHQIRITFDDNSNTVFVQAAPADLTEIRELIWLIDNTASSAVSDLRIVRLNYAVAAELAVILQRAISEGVASPSGTGAGVFPAAGGVGGAGIGGGAGGLGGGLGQQGGFGQTGGFGGGLGQGGGFGAVGGIGGQLGGAGGLGGLTGGTRTGFVTKTSTLRFFAQNKEAVQSGILEDVRLNADPRINALIIAAPEKTMDLIMALITDLDVAPNARALINIFTLKKADAVVVAGMLQQLFLGSATGQQGLGGGLGGVPGAIGGVPGALTGGILGQQRPLALTLTGQLAPGVMLVDLRVTVDQRTNSIIVAGSQNDLDVIEAIISRLEDGETPHRFNEVYRLKNANAADVAFALNDFITKSLTVLTRSSQLTPFQDLLREVIIVPEPISNALLVSATPQYFGDIMKMIVQLDQLPPQVMIQALIAEVDLSANEEFGVEIGLQTPILFRRGLLPSGVTANTTTFDAAIPGFNFNTVAPLGNSAIEKPAVVGFQGITNLGVGRNSPTSNVGGFVFQASSQSFNLLVRALRTQGRIDVLSRPQVMAADNQQARILIGQSFPFVTGSNVTQGITVVPTVTNTIDYRDIGVQLRVTPKINPDGTVIMRVVPEVSSVLATSVEVATGVNAVAFNVQTVETTIIAQDGETVAIGGMISKRNDKQENKVPWWGDLPGIGSLFRYRTQFKTKTELIVILTPHIVRNRADADRILAEETRRIDWILGDVLKTHGTSGMEPVMPPPTVPGVTWPGPTIAPPVYQQGPVQGEQIVPAPGTPLSPEALPSPRTATPTIQQSVMLSPPQTVNAQPGYATTAQPAGAPVLLSPPLAGPPATSVSQAAPSSVYAAPPGGDGQTATVPETVSVPQVQGRESRPWQLFRKRS